MEIYQLRYFAAVAHAGSLVAAAAACHVTQPTLSAQIKALEAELNTRLLERHAWGVRLTRAGERLLTTANRIFDDIERVKSDIAERRYGRMPTLRLGLQPYLSAEVYARSLHHLRVTTPDLHVTLHERPNPGLLDMLLGGGVDLCLMSKPARWPAGVQAQELAQIPCAAYCRKDHPLARNARPILRDLLPYPLLVFSGPPDIGNTLSHIANLAKVDLHIAITTDLASSAFAMAAAGAGVAVLPAVFGKRCARNHLLELPLHDAGLHATVCAVSLTKTELSPGAELLMQHIRRNPSSRRPQQRHR